MEKLSDSEGRKTVRWAGVVSVGLMLLLPLRITGAAAEEIVVAGEKEAILTMIAPFVDTFQEETRIALTVNPSGPSVGLIQLQRGEVDVVAAAAALDDIIADTAEMGVRVDPATLYAESLWQHRSKVLVNEGVAVPQLTKEQLKGIFSGKLTNWRQVGGKNQRIVVVWDPSKTGPNLLFQRVVLGGLPVRAPYRKAEEYVGIRNMVAALPGAIGVVPERLSNGKGRAPATVEISTPILVLAKAPPSPKVRKLFRFLKEIAASFE